MPPGYLRASGVDAGKRAASIPGDQMNELKAILEYLSAMIHGDITATPNGLNADYA